MSFVQINYGTSTPLPGPRTLNNGALIGRVSTMPTENPFYVRTQTDLDTYLTDTTSALYKSVQEFIANKGSTNAGVWCWALSGSAEVFYDVSLDGLRDGVNLTFRSPYSPVEYITGVETKISGTWSAVPSDWYYNVTGNGGKSLGSISFYSTGMYWTGAEGLFTGALLLEGIRADVGVNALSKAYNGLIDKDWYCLAFAYDQSATQALDPDKESAFKFASGQCIGGSGWMDDILIGANMALAFQSESHGCVFFATVPDGVKTNTKMTGYALDTYSGNIYLDLKSIVGNNAYFSPFVGNQTTLGKDMGVMGMALSLRDHPRMTMVYAIPSSYSQTNYPIANEVNAWRNNGFNPFIRVKIGSTLQPCIGGNNTFGVGEEADLSFVRCRDIIRDTLHDDCQAMLMRRNLKYNIAGIKAIENQIVATMNYLIQQKYCDGLVSINIPIKSYVANESGLDEAQTAILRAKRASGFVDNIEVKIKWDGHVIGLIINPLSV